MPDLGALSYSSLPRLIQCAYSLTFRKPTPPPSRMECRPMSRCRRFPSRSSEERWRAPPTLLTEVDVPNKDGRLLRGSFGEVHFSPKINTAKVTVPVNAMLFRQEGARLAIVGADNQAQLPPTKMGRDYGGTLEVLGGVSLGDRIIVNPADSLEDGQTVNVAPDRQEGHS